MTRNDILSLAGLEASGESLAVAAGKAVIRALDMWARVQIEDISLDDAQWSEMTAYLARRGVEVKGNVARLESL